MQQTDGLQSLKKTSKQNQGCHVRRCLLFVLFVFSIGTPTGKNQGLDPSMNWIWMQSIPDISSMVPAGTLPGMSADANIARKNDPHAPKPKCDLPLFHALETNQAIDALLTRLTASTEWLYQKILDSIDNTEKSRDIDAERKQVGKRAYCYHEKSSDRLLDLYLSGDMDKATYQDKNQPLQDRKRGLEARLEKLKNTRSRG